MIESYLFVSLGEHVIFAYVYIYIYFRTLVFFAMHPSVLQRATWLLKILEFLPKMGLELFLDPSHYTHVGYTSGRGGLTYIRLYNRMSL